VIQGLHITLFTPDAHGLRKYFRDILRFPYADAGGGWLIFDLPAEIGCHPDEKEGQRVGPGTGADVVPELSFSCDDIHATVAELSSRGVEFTQGIVDEGYGLLTRFKIPGRLEVDLYQPSYQKQQRKQVGSRGKAIQATSKPVEKSETVVSQMRSICLALPEAKETLTLGKPHFRVRDKIFAGCGEEKGVADIGFKLTKPHAASVVRRPGFRKAQYGGRHGWVSVAADAIEDWDEVDSLIRKSYCLVAPKNLAKIVAESTRGQATAVAKSGRRKTKKSGRKSSKR
jgi:predicted DNA-binding protein (MmcQ/YjbR family)